MEGWFLFTYSAKKEKQKRGERERVFPLQQSSIASESKDSEHQSWPWARKREDRRGGKLELTDSGPYWESWVRKKKKDMDWLKKMERKEKVKAKEKVFLLQKKEHELDRTLLWWLSTGVVTTWLPGQMSISPNTAGLLNKCLYKGYTRL